jgi:hypothetical protein
MTNSPRINRTLLFSPDNVISGKEKNGRQKRKAESGKRKAEWGMKIEN